MVVADFTIRGPSWIVDCTAKFTYVYYLPLRKSLPTPDLM